MHEPVAIEYLASRPERVPVLASWVYGYWGKMYRMKLVAEQIEKISERLNRDRFPLALGARGFRARRYR